nr:MAG TPA: hypothetical protein [Caudoviricetes sp.]
MVTSCSIAKNKSTPTLYPRKVESREYSLTTEPKTKTNHSVISST